MNATFRSFLISSLVVMIVGTLPMTARSGGYFVPEMDAEAMGQSIAWAARTDGASSVFFNPAGLTKLDGWEVSLGTTAVQFQSEVTGPLPTSFKTESDDQWVTPSHLFVGYGGDSDLSYGFGVYTPFGLRFEYPQRWPNGLDHGSFVIEEVELRAIYLTPSVAYQISDSFSIGGGVDWVLASATLENQSDLSDLAAAAGLPGVEPLQLRLEADNGSGNVGFNIGIQYQQKPIAVALTYHSGIDLELEGDADFTTPVTGIPQVDQLLPQLFPDQTGSTEIPIPDYATLGLAYMPSDAFAVEFDVTWMQWSDFDEFTIDFEQETTVPGVGAPALTDSTVHRDWDDGITYRLGTAFDLTDQFQARLGGIYDPNIVPDETLDAILPESDRMAYNVGFGASFEHVDADFAYLYIQLDERTTRTNEEGFNATYEADAHLFGITFTFKGGQSGASM